MLEDVTNVAEEAVSSGHGDCEEAGDFFDCFEGVGIGKHSCNSILSYYILVIQLTDSYSIFITAMKDGFVEARRRSF